METTITVFAWIGLVTTITLSFCTALIWLSWVWKHLLEVPSQMIGNMVATYFYIGNGWLVRNKEKAAAFVLYARFRYLKKHSPAIAEHFERYMKNNGPQYGEL